LKPRQDALQQNFLPALVRYGGAVGGVALAAGVRFLLDPVLGDSFPFVTLIFAVVASAWLAGSGPTLVATALGAAVGDFLFLQPRYSFGFDQPKDGVTFGVFIALGVLTAALSRRAGQAARLTREVAERRQAQADLQENRERLQAALAASGTGTFRWDLRTDALDWDESLDRLFGLSPGETARSLDQFLQLVHPEDRTAVAERCARCAAEGADFEMDFRVVWPDGTVRWLADRGKTYLGADGHPLSMAGACMDITDRKRIEEDRERFAFLVENTHDFIGICDPEGVPLYVNRAGMRMVGLDGFDQVLRTHVADFFFPEDRALIFDEFFPAVIRDGAREVEVRFRHFKTGEALWMTYGVVALRDPAGRLTGLATVSRNVSERKRMEETLREADRRKDDFLAILAHELRNPLAPVRNAIQVLKLADGDGKATRKAREIIERQVAQMGRLVDDLMDVSRIRRGKIALRRERTGLRAVVQMAVETCRPLIEAAGHELRVDLPASDLALDADPARLVQVLSNLLSNAAKYMERGGSILLSGAEKDGWAVIRVRDTGLGIAADALGSIFDPFAQVDRSLERSQGGLGIGLALVRSLVEVHGGTVEAHSDGPGKGSELVVRLPLASSTGMPEAAGAPAQQETVRCGRKVLLADDNRDSAESLATLLELFGHQVRVVHDGIAALEVARAFRPEVALLDIGMPGLNGYEVAQRLRQEMDGPLTLIALTGWGQDEDRLRSREAGFDHHLVKPADPDVLKMLLAEAVPAEQ
jgi:PAS domain S-box-containing protein